MSAAAIDPRVAEQMRLIKERAAREDAARVAEREALARQLEESKILWEAELRIEMESVPLTPANIAFIQGLAGMGCTSSSTAPLRAEAKVPATHLTYICPYGMGGRWGHNNHICQCRKAPCSFTSWLEREKHAFRATWLRREYELIAAASTRPPAPAPAAAIYGPELPPAPAPAAAPAHSTEVADIRAQIAALQARLAALAPTP